MEGCSIIENILTNQGLHLISDELLGYLDFGTLLVCRQASKTWRDTLDERFSLTEKIPVINFILAFGKRNAGFDFEQDHTGATNHILSKNSHIENPYFYKILISEITFFTKFTSLKSHFSQNPHFQSLIFHKIHIFQTSNSW